MSFDPLISVLNKKFYKIRKLHDLLINQKEMINKKGVAFLLN